MNGEVASTNTPIVTKSVQLPINELFRKPAYNSHLCVFEIGQSSKWRPGSTFGSWDKGRNGLRGACCKRDNLRNGIDTVGMGDNFDISIRKMWSINLD